LRLFVAVGTAAGGFDALVEAADRAALRLGMTGLAQIGEGRFCPRQLRWRRFVAPDELAALLARRPLVVTHGGMGLLGDAMRAGCRIVAVPRARATSRRHPSNDQRAFLERLAQRYPIRLCRSPEALEEALAELALAAPAPIRYPLGSTVPQILRTYLQQHRGSRHRRARPVGEVPRA